MKKVACVFAAMIVAVAIGCDNKTTDKTTPPAADNPGGGVEVSAPGVDVDVEPGKVDVKAPGADVEVDRAN